MAVKLRGNANKLAYLLSEYGLSDRIMDSFDSLEKVAGNTVNFENVNNLLIEKRAESLSFLKTAIGDREE